MNERGKIMNKFPILFSPLKVGPLTLKNRIISAPMSMTELSPKQSLSEANIAFFEALAKGGSAVVTIGESIIRTENGKTHHQMIMLGDEGVISSLAEVADAIHTHGAYASIEISHGGAMADPKYNNGKNSIGPVTFVDEYGDTIQGMDEAMMEDVAEAFAEAAATVKIAGFDMCMIHAGHGWLLSQFLSPLFNTRTDEYGGSFENRVRFPLLVLERVRQRVGRDFALDMRISGSEFLEGGIEIDETVKFAELASKYVDIINVSAGAPWTKRMVPNIFDERGINAVFAAEVKKHVKNVPVTTVGAFVDPEHMERVLEEGGADGFIIGRGLLADPELPNKARTGSEDDITKCIRCFCCNEGLYSHHMLKCSVNPVVGRELRVARISHPEQRKKVLVAGGGPSGMQAAITAAKRGHDVTLYEKTDKLGGALNFAEHVSFKKDLNNYKQLLERRVRAAGVRINLSVGLTPDIARNEAPDVIIAAVGAEPIIPPISGVDNKKVIIAANMYDSGVEFGKKVVVIGGGLVGVESALWLSWNGHDVTVLEMKDEMAEDAAPGHRMPLMEKLEESVALETCTRCVSITDEGVLTETSDGETKLFPADTILLAAGSKALSASVEALRDCAPDFWVTGDCRKPKKVLDAVRSGFDAGMNL